jgi:nucleotide-sensitive chloride channel 1A
MAIRHLDASPKIEDFTPLQEHQEQTPATFFGSKPVLYDAAFFRFNIEGEGEDSLIKDVEIWVNAE